ncbi:MAG: toxin-antitoxin system HicB family antitoxin, partial [Candidatus Peregrinibacteria bacterium]
DTVEELHEGVIETIEISIEQRKKEGRQIPPPDRKTSSNFKGKIILRTNPQLHEKLFNEAQAHQMSLNKYIESKLAP